LNRSPVENIYESLSTLNASWAVGIGRPSEPGWISGTDLRDACGGPFNELLLKIGARAQTADRRTIAASFALRYGWASAMAIAPYLKYRCVPDVSLENVSFKFRDSTFFERTAIHDARGSMVAGDPRSTHPSITIVDTPDLLLRTLRAGLVDQATPVVEALRAWSGFAPRGTWGMLTSAWAAQFIALCEQPNDHRPIWPVLTAFFAGDDVVAAMQPLLHAVTWQEATHLYQRRASCCRYYLLPKGDLCASCPLVSHDDRLERNRAWMKTQLERQAAAAPRGHS
jgi:hypothetical protein